MVDKTNSYIYAPCADFKWTQPDQVVDEELTKEISQNYRTLPSFENTVFERKYIKHYSLERHELLKCRWKQYVKHIEDRVYAPFQFPENRDIHFHNGRILFKPAVSIHRFPSYRLQLKPGPGVDYYGQMPIPNELFMKRGKSEKEDDGKTKKRVTKKSAGKRTKKVEH